MSAGDGDALLLTAGKLRRQVLGAVGETHALERRGDALCPLRRPYAAVDERKFHIFLCGELGDQIEVLENEADLLIADAGELLFAVVLDGDAVEPVGPGVRYVQTADDVHQRGLAAAGGADDAHELLRENVQRHMVERVDALLADLVDLGNVM